MTIATARITTTRTTALRAHSLLRLGAPLTLALALAACGDDAPAISTLARTAATKVATGDAAATEYFASDFVDHQTGTAGTGALSSQLAAIRAAHPDARMDVYRVLTEGDQVFVHGHVTLDDGTRGLATADFYRFAGDKIVEHWGDRQEVPASTASGNDMFSTLSAPVRLDPDPDADPAVTRATMGALASALIVDKDLSAWDRYVKPPYYQHSVNTPNGVEAVKEIWGPIVADPTVVITPVTSIADGDLFVTMNLIDSPTLHLTTVDLSRVREALVLEHWDVVEFRP